MNTLFFRFTAAVGWLLLSGYLLFAPASTFSKRGLLFRLLKRMGLSGIEKKIPLDKIVHVMIFFGLVLLWHRAIVALRLTGPQKRFLILFNLAGWCCLGIASEFLQDFLQSGRQFNQTDMIADLAGCVAGGWMAKKLTPVETGVATKTNCL